MSCRPPVALQRCLIARNRSRFRASPGRQPSLSTNRQSCLGAPRGQWHTPIKHLSTTHLCSSSGQGQAIVKDSSRLDTPLSGDLRLPLAPTPFIDLGQAEELALEDGAHDEEQSDSNCRTTHSQRLSNSAAEVDSALQNKLANKPHHIKHLLRVRGDIYLDQRWAKGYWSTFSKLLWNKEACPQAEDLLRRLRSCAVDFLSALQLGTGDRGHARGTTPGPQWHYLQIIVGCLAESAELTFAVIESLAATNCLSFIIRADCLRYLSRFRWSDLEADADLMRKFRAHLSALRNPELWPAHILPQHMNLLVAEISNKEALDLLKTIIRHHDGKDWIPGLRRALDIAIALKNADLALSILGRFPRAILEQADSDMMHRIVNLLSLETVEGDSTSGFFTILPQVLKLGVKPHEMVYNIAITNAVRLSLAPLAWDLKTYAQEEGIALRSRPHLALLKDSFLKQDLQRLNEIMSEIHERDDLSKEPYLIVYTMNMVRVICYFQRNDSVQELLAHILTIYDRAYNRGPLIKLGILPGYEILPSTASFPDPSPMVLAFTIWTYVYVQRRDRDVMSLWHRWTELVEQGDPLFLESAKYDAPYNGFLLFLLRNNNTVMDALSVLRFMAETGYCSPTERTWSICIIAYLKYSFSEQAPAPRIGKMLHEYKAKVSEEDWKMYVQNYWPDLAVDGEEARRWVKARPSEVPFRMGSL